MKKHHRNELHFSKKDKPYNKRLVLFGAASLIWFIFRTGTKPSRVVYPCQRAALANSSILLGLSIPLWLTSMLTKTKKFISRKGITLAILLIIANMVLSSSQYLGNMQLAGAANPNQELYLSLEPMQASSSPASNLYLVNGPTIAHVNELINLMGSNGLLVYKSETSGYNKGPNGLIANNDVVLIKINEEWPYRGGTNTDILKELIQALVDHPDGFVGEIVVADNGQWQGSMNWPESNAEDHAQSTQDVVNTFSTLHKVSTYSWIPIRSVRVNEYSSGDNSNGYVLYDTSDPETGILVSYPKFQTTYGTYVSFKNGIWNGTDYEKRLKVINMPVLKTHSTYGVTASLKHYMGVQSQGEGQPGLANGHSTVATGGMGTLMVETRLPTLNIIDAVWVNANPPPFSGMGPGTPYNQATRVNVLMASADPVALDYWAAKHILMQTANLIGHTDTHTINPDNTDRSGVSGEAFGVWLSRTKNEIVAGGYPVTSDENKMNVYVKSEEPLPTPSPSTTPASTPTPNPTGSPSQSPTLSPSSSPLPSVSPSATDSPSPTPTTSPYPPQTPTPPPSDPSLLLYGLIGGTIIFFAAILAVLLFKK
ncbi:DUF362 domain-containing protein [Candidatus Bathyarchaeota archaeon]|nr:DUF362 domain-containing protein [Candidatus Bathyarchaeota archaeon]